MFNSLNSAGLIEDRRCVDLFAGSGALGLEALSRGAAHVLFVDSDRRAISTIARNVDELEFGDRSSLRRGDSVTLAARGTIEAEVAFLDPPYEFDEWPSLLTSLVNCGIDAVAIESDRTIDPGSQWEVLKEKAYGGTVVVIARRAQQSAAGNAS